MTLCCIARPSFNSLTCACQIHIFTGLIHTTHTHTPMKVFSLIPASINVHCTLTVRERKHILIMEICFLCDIRQEMGLGKQK